MKKNIVVIGAGLAGTLISNELAKKFKVTLLEAGKKDSISYPKIKYTKKQLAAVKTFCHGGGGTTNLWHNGLIPIHPRDVTSPLFRQILEETKAFQDKAAANLFWLDDPYSAEYQKVVSETEEISGKIGVFSDGIDCLLYPKKFSKLVAGDNIDSFYEVRDINFYSVDRKINSISFLVGQEKFLIEPDNIIISAGTLGSPSFVRDILSALGISHENVGAGLADHPLGFVGKVRVKESVNNYMKKLSVLDQGNYECRTAIRVKSDCGKYTGCAFLRPALTMANKLRIYKYKSLLGASSGTERIKNIFSWKLFHPDILAEIYSHLFGINIPGRIYNILFLFEQKRGTSYVSNDDETIEVGWSITNDELAIYNEMIQKLSGMLEEIADEINLKENITEDWLWSAAHHSGTISLGEQADDLVDKDLRLSGCDNVYICDGSVIQEHSYANTGLIIGSLAMRLADKVINE